MKKQEKKLEIGIFLKKMMLKLKEKTLTTFFVITILIVSALITESCKRAISKEEIQIYGTPDEPVTDIDGNTYRTVKIGDQIWMAESLRTSKYNDGEPITYLAATPQGAIDPAWGNLRTGAYSFGRFNSSLKPIYGAWYNWYAVNTGKLAPAGWHVPTVDEWNILIESLGGKNVAGGKMKATGTEYWFSPNSGATNSSGFSAYPAGYRNYDGLVLDLTGDLVSFWASDQANDNQGYEARLACDRQDCLIGESSVNKNYGYSIRCIKD